MTRTPRLGLALLALVLLSFSAGARAVVFTEYPLPLGSYPNFLALDYDGSVVFSEFGRDKIGRIKDGLLDELPTSTGCGPVGVTISATGGIYYACANIAAMGHVSFKYGEGNEDALPATPAGPLASGPDGNLWFGSGASMRVVTHLWSPVASESVDTASEFYGVAFSGDGGVWAADPKADFVYRFTRSSVLGHLDFSWQGAPTAGAHPRQLTWCHGRGFVYVAQTASNKLVRASWDDSLQEIQLVEHPATLSGPAAGIACGLDGSIWFTVPATNKVGRIKADDTVEEFTVPTALSVPFGIVVGPDNSVWFAENTAHKIGRLRLHPPSDANGDGTVNVSDVFYLINFLFAGGPEPVP